MIHLNTNKTWKLNLKKSTTKTPLLPQPDISLILWRTKARKYLNYLQLNDNTHIYITIKNIYGFSCEEVERELVISILRLQITWFFHKELHFTNSKLQKLQIPMISAERSWYTIISVVVCQCNWWHDSNQNVLLETFPEVYISGSRLFNFRTIILYNALEAEGTEQRKGLITVPVWNIINTMARIKKSR